MLGEQRRVGALSARDRGPQSERHRLQLSHGCTSIRWSARWPLARRARVDRRPLARKARNGIGVVSVCWGHRRSEGVSCAFGLTCKTLRVGILPVPGLLCLQLAASSHHMFSHGRFCLFVLVSSVCCPLPFHSSFFCKARLFSQAASSSVRSRSNDVIALLQVAWLQRPRPDFVTALNL